MFHTERDAATFFAEILLLMATAIEAVYAAGVWIAVGCKLFQSLRALHISLVLSAIASVPVAWALLLQWPYLPDEWDRNLASAVLLVVDSLLLCWVWAAPVTQYRLTRRSS